MSATFIPSPRLLSNPNPNGVVIYQGPSMLDGAPIVVIVTGLKSASANGKTGAMLQSFILRQDRSPVEAIKDGTDASVCGNCPNRPLTVKAALAADPTADVSPCYVKAFHAPRSVWQCWATGSGYRMATEEDRAIIAASNLRHGTYGDPMAAPFGVWPVAPKRTGYSHQWADYPQSPFAAVLMASVDSPVQAAAAVAAGWRYFRVETDPEAPLLPGEVMCPASEEAGKRTTCDTCGLCKGNPWGARSRKPANVRILDHSTRGRARNRRARLAVV